MKRFVIMLLTLCCILAACGTQNGPAPTDAPTEAPTVIPTEAPTDAPTEVPTEAPAHSIINPLPPTIDINNLDNCTVAVSLEQGDIYVDDAGATQMNVTVYTYDLYDMVDIAMLRGGDTILIRGKEVVIEALDRRENGAVLINGGLDMGGYELWTDENTVYYETGYSDAKSWYQVGEAVIEVAKDFVFTDASDLDNGPATYTFEDLVSDDSSIHFYFDPQSTTVTIQDGLVVSMERTYTP